MASSKDKQSSYEFKSGAGEKEGLVFLLKARIFELEQNEKSYNELNAAHMQLQNELKLANEERLRTEYEMKQKTEVEGKKMMSLASENENFQQIINDKVAINKKLYADNETLLKQLYSIEGEYQEVLGKCNEQHASLEAIQSRNQALHNEHNELIDVKDKMEVEIKKLFEDNRKLNSICKEKEFSLKQAEQDRIQLISKIEEMSYELNNLKGKVKSKEENLSFVQSQNDDYQQQLGSLQLKMEATEKESDMNKNDLGLLQMALTKERAVNDNLKKAVEEKDRQIKQYAYDVDVLNKTNVMISQDNNKTNDHNDKIQDQLMLLSKANNRLVSEIEGVIDQDEQMKSALQRKERIISMLKQNKSRIEGSLNAFHNESKQQQKHFSPMNRSIQASGIN